MSIQDAPLNKLFLAVLAFVWFFAGVNSSMHAEMVSSFEFHRTMFALEGSLATVAPEMDG